ncbi:MAG TPA: BadF/BadG/BcrA/BcrD ATPase family protein [Terriglobales bacterium]|nr:BadF/BadG/BcrA/BcrD ATPase family protein [Terriglobales bacterium]
MAYFLGIDGGGSKTHCLVGDETSVLASGTGGGSNVVRVGEAKAEEALISAIGQACSAAKIAPRELSRVCIGASGGARPEVADSLRRIISEVITGEILIVGDTVTTLAAAFGRGPGVIVIAGTGSLAYGRNSQGEIARAGGWGHAISDEGSGHWIGRAAIAAALRASDKRHGKDSALLSRIMKVWDVETHGQLVLAANASPAPDFAALLPAVLAAAESGDPEARKVLIQAGTELAALAEIVIRRLFATDQAVPVAMSGGVFRHCPLTCQAFQESLCAACPQATVQAEIVEPVRGALELARKGS